MDNSRTKYLITAAAYRMQEAMNNISNWASDWMVTINKTKNRGHMFFTLSFIKLVCVQQLQERRLAYDNNLGGH